MIEPHLHWTFMAFNGEPIGEIHWAVQVSVTGHYTEEEAQIAAASMIRREHYKLQRVYECTTCGYQESAAKSMEDIAKAHL